MSTRCCEGASRTHDTGWGFASWKPGQPLPADHTLGRIHTNGGPWRLLGWKGREIAATDDIDPSVRYRIDATAGPNWMPAGRDRRA